MAQPLQSATLDVPLAPLNQHATQTGGPVGRIKKLLNAVVKKTTLGTISPPDASQAPVALRVEKRDGWATLPSQVRDPATGAISSKTLSGPTLFGTYGAQLVAVFLAAPFVLSEAAACWESPTYNAPTQVLRAKAIYNGSTISATPDEVRIGTRVLYAWSDLRLGTLYRTMVMVIDDDGTIIRQPFQVDTKRRVRACADGTQFWVIWDTELSAIAAAAYDINGNALGSGAVGSASTGYFDVTPDTNSANSIVMLQKDPASTGVQLTRFTWNGAAIVTFQQAPTISNNSTGRVAFLTNQRNDHRFHVTTVDGAGPFTTYIMSIFDASLSVAVGPFIVKAGDATAPVEAAGFVAPTGNADWVIGLSYLDATPTPQLNSTLIYNVTAAGVSTLKRTQRSLTLATRAFRLQVGGDYYAVGYYHSNPAGVTVVAQSTYFLMDLGTGYQVTGRFEYGTAYQDWLTTADTTRYGYVSTPQVDPTGRIHMALPYRASSTIALVDAGFDSGPFKTVVDVVGIKDYQFGPDSGQSVEHSAALFLPGPEAVNYTGATFAEDGIGLIPEVTSIANAGTVGSLTGTYEYVVVDEWTDNNGQRVRSPSGIPYSITGSAFQVTLTGLNNHVTRKQGMAHAIYRTVIKGGVQTTEHYKVTGSLQAGVYLGGVVVNDDTANTWTFTDNMPDGTAANNEVLYTDKGLLDHFPAPPFSVGLATFDRIFVAGYDGAIWFSGAKTDGDAFWFHPGQRIPLPTQEEVKAIRVLDDAIVVLCGGGRCFMIPNGPWPDATGAGSFPSPRVLPFSNGCTGFAETISDGIIYSATQGGIWLITRDFQNRYIGASVEDEKADSETFVGVASDDRQRTVFLTSGGNMLVYDQVTDVWGTWSGATSAQTPTLLTSHKGRIAYMPVSGAPLRQLLGQYHDASADAIVTSVRLRAAPGGIRRYKRLWQVQMVGSWLGDHDMQVQAFIDDSPTVTASQLWTPNSAVPYVYELPANAITELCSAIDYVFQDSFPRGASQGFALEALCLQVGLGDRSKDVPASRRIGT